MVDAPEVRARQSSMEGTTNTIIITKVPPALLHPSVTPSLKEFFERFGSIEAWVPLTAFDRVVVVYTTEQAVEKAKEAMDYTLVEGFGPVNGDVSQSLLRVYRGMPTPVDIVRNRRLRDRLPVPATDKNFLISPPGSPPVGWEQIREDPPNLDTLADDLVKALESLSVGRFPDSSADIEEENEGTTSGAGASGSPISPAREGSTASPRDTLILPHLKTDSGDLPSVMVSDTDIAQDSNSSTAPHGLSIADAFDIQRRSMARTGAPGPISQVKATVESMQGSSFSAGTTRIDRTPRPPLQDY